MTTQYDKLVRDRIPEIIEQDDDTPVVHLADDGKYGRRLDEKRTEEAAEPERSGEIEELADVLELVYAIRDSRDAGRGALEERRRKKADTRGNSPTESYWSTSSSASTREVEPAVGCCRRSRVSRARTGYELLGTLGIDGTTKLGLAVAVGLVAAGASYVLEGWLARSERA